jgi:hypothetical protein
MSRLGGSKTVGPTAVAIVAPAAFGKAAVAYLGAAADAIADAGAVRGTLVDEPGSLRNALDGLAEGDVVLGSLGSELAAEVAGLALERGLVHVEAGAIGDDAIGPNSFRLTPDRAELARGAADLAVGRRVGLVVEESHFGRTMCAALRTALASRAIEVVADDDDREVLANPGAWLRRHRVEAVVAALRGALPEQLVAAVGATREVEICVGAAGAWTRAEVGQAAGASACRVVFCEVIAPRTDADWSLYADLGHAAGAVVSRVLGGPQATREALRELQLDAPDSPFGYGVRFDERGGNERARAVLLQWQDRAITTYDSGGRA